MLFTAFIVSLICILVAIGRYRRFKKYANLPPGPRPLPIIGNAHQLKAEGLHLDFTELGKKWGDIFTVYFLTKPTVVFNSFSAMREALVSPEYTEIFSGRDLPHFSKEIFAHNLLFNPNMDEVHYLRKMLMRGIKMYGTHLKNVEHYAQTELTMLIDNLRKLEGQPIDPSPFVDQYTTNIMLILIAGQRFDTSHTAFNICNEVAEDFDRLLNYKNAFLLETVPFARRLFSDLGRRCRRLINNRKYFNDAFASLRKQSGDVMAPCLYTFLEDEANISEELKQGVLIDAINTGVLTTRPTLLLVLAAMVLFPDTQKRIQKELDEVVGRDRFPSLDDKPNLHYTQAAMFEIFRFYTPVVLPGPRTANQDCTFRGYFIPKGTQTTYNLWNVNHDEKFWDDPFTFDPSRFLDEEGNLLPPEDEKRQRLLTFGLGKRSCTGEVLARVRIFLALAAILQNFKLKRDPNLPFPSPDPRTYEYTFIATPPPYKLCFEPRV